MCLQTFCSRRVVNGYVTPKIEAARRRIAALEAQLVQGGTRQDRRQRDAAVELLRELEGFRAELLLVAALPYEPNLDDGVLLTAAPLWKLFRLPKWRKDLEGAWKRLEKGDYDWAHVARSIWPERVREVCRRDRSIAIAHGLEDICEVSPPGSGVKKDRKGKAMPVESGTLINADEEG